MNNLPPLNELVITDARLDHDPIAHATWLNYTRELTQRVRNEALHQALLRYQRAQRHPVSCADLHPHTGKNTPVKEAA